MPLLPTSPRHRLLLAAVLATGVTLLVLRGGRGPELPGYAVQERPLVQRVVASGQVSSQSLVRVGSEVTGVVKARHVREGDQVRPGDLLLELTDDEQQARVREAEAALARLAGAGRPQAEAALRQAESALALAGAERVRREELFTRQLLSAEARDQARNAEVAARSARDQARAALATQEAGGTEERLLRERLAQARAALARTRLQAPVAGIVQTRDVEPGDLVQPGRALLTIARSDSREIVVALDEKSLAPLATGQAARVVADAWPDRPVAARVSFIAPAVDTGRGTVDVHLDLVDAAPFLRQGMTVSVNIETARLAQALVLPNDALHEVEGNRAVVFLLADGRVQRRPVTVGLRSSTQSQVLDGLRAGEVVLAAEAEPGARARVRLTALPEAVAGERVDPSALPMSGN